MGGYTGINYEENVDSFAKFSHVKSTLIYGDADAVKKSWLTVIIPTCKRVDLLKYTLESVLTQWHTDFDWDIVVLDNEPYDGKENDTEKLIRSIDNKRVLYYRNSENLKPGDNFNRGIYLARGKWIFLIHDGDLLIASALQKLERIIRFYEKKPGKPLGAISTAYMQIKYDPQTEKVRSYVPDFLELNHYLSSLRTDYNLYKLTHNHILFTAYIGRAVLSNGTIFNREAVIKIGGFNEDYGISTDMILYRLEYYYSVYSTFATYGFYRWGNETMVKPELSHKLIKSGFEFREYAYRKNALTRLMGAMFRACHYQRFLTDVIKAKNYAQKEKNALSDFDDIYSKRPSKFGFFLYTMLILRPYLFHKKLQSKRLNDKDDTVYPFEIYHMQLKGNEKDLAFPPTELTPKTFNTQGIESAFGHVRKRKN